MTDDALRPPRPDAGLVDRARKGDTRAMDELVRRHHATVYRTALGILHDEDRAQDAAQETFLKALRGLETFRGATYHTGDWPHESSVLLNPAD